VLWTKTPRDPLFGFKRDSYPSMAIIISADEIKKELPNYRPDLAESYHHESARKADQQFYEAIKDDSYQSIILLCGGSASGKTEFLVTHLKNEKGVVLDTTLATVEGARIKITKVLKLKKQIKICSIIPDDLKRAFIAFLNRDRKFSDIHFYKTHSGSRNTLLWIANNFPQITMHIIESSYTNKQELKFAEIKFENRKQLLEYLHSLLMTENDIISSIQSQF